VWSFLNPESNSPQFMTEDVLLILPATAAAGFWVNRALRSLGVFAAVQDQFIGRKKFK
jgi:hypothetical protein